MSGPKMALVLVSKKVKKKKTHLELKRCVWCRLGRFWFKLVDTAHPDLHHTFKIDIT